LAPFRNVVALVKEKYKTTKNSFLASSFKRRILWPWK
jgi:hypothetical protein